MKKGCKKTQKLFNIKFFLKNTKMKKTAITLLLLAAVVGLTYWIWSMLSVPIKFEQHFSSRQQAVIEKEEYIIKLVQGYRDSNPAKQFTTNWDELIDFALNGTMEYRSQIYDENNLENAAILAELRKDKNWKNERVVRVAARDTIFDDDFGVCRLTEEQIQNTEIGEVMKMVMGLNEAPDALKRYTLADIGNTRKVKPDEYRSLVNKFARKYENLSRISRTDYKYTYKANNMKYYWLPIEYLP